MLGDTYLPSRVPGFPQVLYYSLDFRKEFSGFYCFASEHKLVLHKYVPRLV